MNLTETKQYFRVKVSTTIEIPRAEGFLDNGELNLNHLMYLAQKKFEETRSYKLSYKFSFHDGDTTLPLSPRPKQEEVTLKDIEINKSRIK